MAAIQNPEDLHRLDNLEFIARQVVEGFIIGLHKSPYHGFSVEFAEHRLYNSGESVKDIDWKVYARTDKLFVKRFEEETNLRCQLVLDASSSMYYPKGSPNNKIRFSVVSAAALMYLMRKQRDAVGLSIFDNQLEVHTQARSTSIHHKLLMTHLERLLASGPGTKTTAAAACLHQIADHIPKRSLVIIFSDMFDNMESEAELFSALQHLKYARHEVVLFHVTDTRSELDFEFENRPYVFVDMETNEKIKLRAGEVKEYYTRQMQRYKKELMLRCGQYKIDFVEADISRDYMQILLPYLTRRAKMM
ncbi:MAG: hypothetical protein KatS3mg031_0754 [Chitinophagales bacterium]|nr:MAG: hypothetical protein KatS3mg031_0754 [Chitinophagales bacterium]